MPLQNVLGVEIIYFGVGLFLSSIIYAVVLTRKPRRLHHFILQSPAESFDSFAAKSKEGVFQTSFSKYKKQAFFGRFLFCLSIFVLIFALILFFIK